ncbi:MAG TPA: hypothetical protein VN541_01560, partial [Tepidisphaeraceae bacterium]|nr:hypothetical protein [Tepidisphaeraceae bacterium]
HWLRRAYARKLILDEQVQLIKPVLDELAPRLNAYLNSVGAPRRKRGFGEQEVITPSNSDQQETADQNQQTTDN